MKYILWFPLSVTPGNQDLSRSEVWKSGSYCGECRPVQVLNTAGKKGMTGHQQGWCKAMSWHEPPEHRHATPTPRHATVASVTCVQTAKAKGGGVHSYVRGWGGVQGGARTLSILPTSYGTSALDHQPTQFFLMYTRAISWSQPRAVPINNHSATKCTPPGSCTGTGAHDDGIKTSHVYSGLQ